MRTISITLLTNKQKNYNIKNMIIQSKTIMSVVDSFEQIAERSDDVASKYLANALKTASEENRTDLLNFEKNEYEVLLERAEALKEAVLEVKTKFQNDE